MVSERSALIIIDVQNDFCTGGALAVPDGDAVVPVINLLSKRFSHCVLTQDWHPPGHTSFASQHQGAKPFDTTQMAYGPQVLWPDHCVPGSNGAAFHPALDTNMARLIVRKGMRATIDSYSAFYENDHRTATGLGGYLREHGLGALYLCGLATDFCVAYSALDAVREGFSASIVEDASRGIDLDGSLATAWRELEAAGVGRVASDNI
jgi:nicotinamidase/pyrazinamidase